MKQFAPSEFVVDIDRERCILCMACVSQCSFDALFFDEPKNKIWSINKNCVACHRCVMICPAEAITIKENQTAWRAHDLWSPRDQKLIWKQAETGGILLTSCGNANKYRNYFDHLVLDASQVTNPSIDPLREPMELRTYLGKKDNHVEVSEKDGKLKLNSKSAPLLRLDTPIMFGAMSLGAINFNMHLALAQAATSAGTFFNTGEGGLHKSLYKFGPNTIVQVASGRFGVHHEYLNAGAMVEIKVGQGAKPGIGGHLPGEKVNEEISQTRMIPQGSDAISPAPHHDIYSIEDLSQLIYSLKEATDYKMPVSVKIAAVHNSASIASGIARAGADIIAIDGFRGGTGATPQMVRDNVGIPIELALAAVDDRLRAEGIRNSVSIVASGGIRNSSDVVKAIALGADAVYIGTAALIAVGCNVCFSCHTNKCAWGITTQQPHLVRRQNPSIATERLENLLRGWGLEIKEMLGLMGVNALESLRGNRLKLRGIGLNENELKVLGVKHAGE